MQTVLVGIFTFIFLCVFMYIVCKYSIGRPYDNTKHKANRRSDSRSHRQSGFFDHNSSCKLGSRPSGDPFDNHWESSFDWKDEDNDGYDDRDDGSWNEREF
jgi:hypothetical protein